MKTAASFIFLPRELVTYDYIAHGLVRQKGAVIS